MTKKLKTFRQEIAWKDEPGGRYGDAAGGSPSGMGGNIFNDYQGRMFKASQ